MDLFDGRVERSFSWNNLYVSCKGCNSAKKGREDIPVTSCLDPCDTSVDPADHLTFHRAYIQPRRSPGLGLNTIDKFDLGRSDLLIARQTALIEFYETVDRIRQIAALSGRVITKDEADLIRAFAEEARPFSLMFESILRAYDLP